MNWDTLRYLKDKNVHIVGLSSVEGRAVAEFLLSQGFANLTAHDFKGPEEFERSFKHVHVGLSAEERDEAFRRLMSQPIHIHYRETYLEGILEADAIFVSQAWFLYPPNFPRIKEARDKGIPFHTLTELYFDLAPCPIIAVTGTNGKTTTANLIAEIMKLTPRRAYMAGNDRYSVQVLDKLEEMRPEDVLVLEVSNRQLLGLARSPQVAVITNIAPNHLDEHPSFEDYVNTKRALIAHQKPEDFAILNYDNGFTRKMMSSSLARLFPFSRKEILGEGAFVREGQIILRREGWERTVCALSEIPLLGEHNLENVLAATAAAFVAGAEAEKIAGAVRRFQGVKHRLRFVWEMNGVRYYDDLSSTTPQATLAALRAIPAPVVLIAGGGDKGLDYMELGRAIAERARALVLLPGEGTDKLERAVQAAGEPPPIRHCHTLEGAVAAAVELAAPGDAVLLSPACPHFFTMYYLDEGGREIGFRAILRKIAHRNGTQMNADSR